MPSFSGSSGGHPRLGTTATLSGDDSRSKVFQVMWVSLWISGLACETCPKTCTLDTSTLTLEGWGQQQCNCDVHRFVPDWAPEWAPEGVRRPMPTGGAWTLVACGLPEFPSIASPLLVAFYLS